MDEHRTWFTTALGHPLVKSWLAQPFLRWFGKTLNYDIALFSTDSRFIVAPFSARAEEAASVSMPLEWSELNGRLSNSRFHIKNAIARLKRKGDPMAPLLTTESDLEGGLARLGELMAAGE